VRGAGVVTLFLISAAVFVVAAAIWLRALWRALDAMGEEDRG